MKSSTILSALCGLTLVGTASAANINVYYSPSCPHCHHARDFISSTLIYEYPNLQVTEVNVTAPENQNTFQDVLKKCEYESGGVPVLVIGEKCFQGYSDAMQDELRTAVEVDLTDADKATAAENKQAMTEDAEKFKAEHADRTSAISEYTAPVTEESATQKKTDAKKGTTAYFWGLLVVLVVALGFVLARDNKKK